MDTPPELWPTGNLPPEQANPEVMIGPTRSRPDSGRQVVAGTLAAHQVEVAWFRRRGGWAWWCSCHVDGTATHPHPGGAHAEAEAHQAEQITAALARGR